MSPAEWTSLRAQPGPLPSGAPLADLTAELTRMLGDADPQVREEIALGTLSQWLAQGAYDDLLAGFGDGMAAGLTAGLGLPGGAHVRRAASARMLIACLRRDQRHHLLTAGTVLGWADALLTWILAETDLRALGVAGEALTTLAHVAHFGSAEHGVLLEVIAERVQREEPTLRLSDAADLARAAMAVIRRGHDLDLESWVLGLGRSALDATGSSVEPSNSHLFLREVYLQLSLGRATFDQRADLLLLLVDILRELDPSLR